MMKQKFVHALAAIAIAAPLSTTMAAEPAAPASLPEGPYTAHIVLWGAHGMIGSTGLSQGGFDKTAYCGTVMSDSFKAHAASTAKMSCHAKNGAIVATGQCDRVYCSMRYEKN